MKKIEAIVRPERVNDVKQALEALEIHGMNVIPVTGRGAQRGIVHQGRGGEELVVDMLPKVKLELVIEDHLAESAVEAIQRAAHTGRIGDGKIFITNVEEAIRIRTGERGPEAI